MNDDTRKVQKSPGDVQKPQTIEVNGRPARLEDVRVVTINGKRETLVIGREYAFRLKPGAVATPHYPDKVKKAAKAEKKSVKAAPKKAAKKNPAKKASTKKAKPVSTVTFEQNAE